MNIWKNLAVLAFAGASLAAHAVPTQSWVRTLNLLPFDIGYECHTDSLGNLYVLGTRSTVTDNVDWVLIKYSAVGALVWQRVVAGVAAKEDYPSALEIDKQNNVWITGTVDNGGAVGREAVLYKYSPAGALLFLKKHNGTLPAGRDEFYGLAFDSLGNAYVTGQTSSAGTGLDAIVQRYSSAGVLQWTRKWASVGLKEDEAGGILIDKNNNLFVGGTTQTATTSSATDVVLWKLSSATGVIAYTRIYAGVASNDYSTSGLLDPAGNPVISITETKTATNSSTAGLQKRNAATGNLIYGPNKFAAPIGHSAYGAGMAMDAAGNVFVLYGIQQPFTNPGTYTVLVKVNNNGVKQWERTFKTAGQYIQPAGIVIDSLGKVIFAVNDSNYMTGTNVIRLYKYATTGAQTWTFVPKRPAPAQDQAYGLFLHNNATLYITGSGKPNAASNTSDFVTFKIIGL